MSSTSNVNGPYVYPKSKHRRQLNPPQYSAYRKYKPYLRQEFQGQCIYCRTPDSLLGEPQFGVDHYRPKSIFASLSSDYRNLYYCCNACNRYKGNSWHPDNGEFFIPNPVDHVMFSHLRYKQAIVDYVSRAGEFTVELLQLNSKTMVEYREDVLHSIDVNEKTLLELQRAEVAILAKFEAGNITAAQRDAALLKVEDYRFKTVRVLERFQGVYKE